MVNYKMLKKILSQPLGLEKLRSLLPPRSKAVLYETKIDNKKEGHYIVLIPRAHSIEYFSSLGRSPTDEMSSLHQNPNRFQRTIGEKLHLQSKEITITKL